jgi:hypothetical protein
LNVSQEMFAFLFSLFSGISAITFIAILADQGVAHPKALLVSGSFALVCGFAAAKEFRRLNEKKDQQHEDPQR